MGLAIGILTVGFLIILSFNQVVASSQKENYIIEVECIKGSVYPGENAEFIWHVINNDRIFSAEFTPNATERPRHTFEPETLNLKPGEEGQLFQTFNSNDLAPPQQLWFSISWVIKYFGPLGAFRYQDQTNVDISIYIKINQTIIDLERNISKDYDDYRNSKDDSYAYFLLVPLILVPAVIIIFKKFKQERYFDDF